MLVYFGYTYCPDACPTALQTMSTALDDLGDARQGVCSRSSSPSIPSATPVEQMKLYAANSIRGCVALTGTPEQTEAAARAYRIYFAEGEGR